MDYVYNVCLCHLIVDPRACMYGLLRATFGFENFFRSLLVAAYHDRDFHPVSVTVDLGSTEAQPLRTSREVALHCAVIWHAYTNS